MNDNILIQHNSFLIDNRYMKVTPKSYRSCQVANFGRLSRIFKGGVSSWCNG